MRYLTALLAACLSVASFAFDVPCLDPLACNFMEEGECFFTDENGEPCVLEGCTIEGACNYDPEADIYDGSCEFISCLGCTDSEACRRDSGRLRGLESTRLGLVLNFRPVCIWTSSVAVDDTCFCFCVWLIAPFV